MRARRVTTRPFPTQRRLVLAAMRAGRRQAPIHGLLELDVTEARHRLAGFDPPLSMTAFVVASVAREVARHPEVAAYRNWWGRLVMHSAVDVATLLEVETPQGRFPLAHVLRNAHARSVEDLSQELRAVKGRPESSGSGLLLKRATPVVARIPGLVKLMYALLARSPRMRQMSGTVSVTSVGMFGGGGGFGIGFPTIMTLNVLVGGLTRQPRVVDDTIVVREVLQITISVDHRIVDGAPAARFVADLRSSIEAATWLG